MKSKSALSRCASLSLAAWLAAAPGLLFASPADFPQPAGGVVMAGETRQSQDQDPGTPPDCKKYPKDARCKDKK